MKRFIALLAVGMAATGCQTQGTRDHSSPTSATGTASSDGELADRIRSAVSAAMAGKEPQPRDFRVSVERGVATLWGTVSSFEDKSTIEASARAVDGVTRVASRLVVGIP